MMQIISKKFRRVVPAHSTRELCLISLSIGGALLWLTYWTSSSIQRERNLGISLFEQQFVGKCVEIEPMARAKVLDSNNPAKLILTNGQGVEMLAFVPKDAFTDQTPQTCE
nr:hypothetical protein [Neorhizobium tomejilense]